MAEYGLFTRDLPLALGEEQIILFQKKINIRDITTSYSQGNSQTSRIYKEIYLGKPDEIFSVYAEYKELPIEYYAWTGGGWGAIRDYIFAATITDNVLVRRKKGWYLIVFSPPFWVDSGRISTDFYIYKTVANPLPSNDLYGLRVWDSEQRLKYDSGWNMLRISKAIDIRQFLDRSSAKATPMYGIVKEKLSGIDNNPGIKDINGLKPNIPIGDNKLIKVGYAYSLRGTNAARQQIFSYMSPFALNNKAGISAANIMLGMNKPLDGHRPGDTIYGNLHMIFDVNYSVIDKPI